MCEKRPVVSVIIPTYNRAHLVGRAIRSVLQQTYQDFELILVDDASTDDTEEVVKAFDDVRIRYLRHEENSGGSATRNSGIRAARGDYTAFLDSDDEWLPEKLRLQVRCLRDSDKKVGAVYSSYYVQDDESGAITRPNLALPAGDLHKHFLTGWCPSITSSILIRRQVLLNAGLFDPALPSFQDYDLWLRLSKLCEFQVVDKALVINHSHSGVQVATDPRPRLEALNMVMDKWEPLMQKEVGGRATREFRSKHLSWIHSSAVLQNVRRRRRGQAMLKLVRYLSKPKYVSLKRALGLLLAIVAGESVYTTIQHRWRQLKWHEGPLPGDRTTKPS